MTEWMYQIRIVVTSELSADLRALRTSASGKAISKIAADNEMEPVCTFDAFKAYCNEAEKHGLHEFPLYHWTKSTIDDPVKKEKHQKSFAFYLGNEQVYSKALADKLYDDLMSLKLEDVLDIKLIDSNPKNNPQPPKDP